MNHNEARAIVTEFYTKALTVNGETTPRLVLDRILADDFQSINGQESKDKSVLTKQVEGFWKLIPNLEWHPEDFVVDGEKVVVRSIASGAPKGPFMGMTLDGTRSFRIDTIDIHELANGRIARVRHLEDWATAMRQLAGK